MGGVRVTARGWVELGRGVTARGKGWEIVRGGVRVSGIKNRGG